MDTSHARAQIMARIRSAGGGVSAPAPTPVDPLALRPRVGEDVLAHFEEQARRMASTTGRIATLAQAPQALADWLRANGLPTEGVCWETLAGLDWAGAGLRLEPRAPRDADRLGVTGAFAAIAETGTLMLLSGPGTPASTHLLPETHVALVPASRVLRHYEDAFALMRAERGKPARAVNLVSGPSRTGDIEQTIVLGAHGPYRVHLLIVEGQ